MRTNLVAVIGVMILGLASLVSSCKLPDINIPDQITIGNAKPAPDPAAAPVDYENPKLTINAIAYDLKLLSCSISGVNDLGAIDYSLSIVFTGATNASADHTVTFTAGPSSLTDNLLMPGTVPFVTSVINNWDPAGQYQYSGLSSSDVMSINWDSVSISADSFQAKGYIDIKQELSPSNVYSPISGPAANDVQDVYPVQKIYFDCNGGVKATLQLPAPPPEKHKDHYGDRD
ncbi:MAG: hypothetical protein WCQ53_05430 [bacterium]